jgi:hypothetical protein
MYYSKGKRFKAKNQIDMRPYGCIAEGSTLTVEDTDPLNFSIEGSENTLDPMWTQGLTIGPEDRLILANLKPDCCGLRRAIRRISSYKTAAMAASVALLLIGQTFYVYTGISQAWRGPALEIKSAHYASTNIHKGEPLELVVTSRHNRVCMWDFVYTYTNIVTEKVVARAKEAGAGSAVTKEFITHSINIQVPNNLAPGDYIVSMMGHGECEGDSRDQIVTRPPLEFRLLGSS